MRRGAARLLSFYQRAPVHFLAEAGWVHFDWTLSSLIRWALLRQCGKRARYWREQQTLALPSSGWSGSLFVIAVWLGLVFLVVRMLPTPADPLIV